MHMIFDNVLGKELISFVALVFIVIPQVRNKTVTRSLVMVIMLLDITLLLRRCKETVALCHPQLGPSHQSRKCLVRVEARLLHGMLHLVEVEVGRADGDSCPVAVDAKVSVEPKLGEARVLVGSGVTLTQGSDILRKRGGAFFIRKVSVTKSIDIPMGTGLWCARLWRVAWQLCNHAICPLLAGYFKATVTIFFFQTKPVIMDGCTKKEDDWPSLSLDPVAAKKSLPVEAKTSQKNVVRPVFHVCPKFSFLEKYGANQRC